VTRHPTDAWVAQQLREATPFDRHPRHLIRDSDAKYGPRCTRLATASGIRVLRTPVRAPRANAVCARFLGSVRRACLEHPRIFGERQLLRVLREDVAFFNRARPHQGLGHATPAALPAETKPCAGPVRAVPVLGGLHHRYERAA